ncbi:hypothetical protein MMC19_004596 [Ptychographa xylographoides]|nr:hypothetical protein [Ptychographa xylographoides]
MIEEIPVATANSADQSSSGQADVQRNDRKSNATTGASAAGARVLATRLIAFYFRAPAKAFLRTRVDYLAFARAINPRYQAKEAWSWRMSTIGILGHAVRAYGWGFIPNQVLPPLMANVLVGTALYTSYLQVLGAVHHPSAEPTKRIYPPPPIGSTFMAGLMAGTVQSIVAAPLDALQIRFKTTDMLEGRYRNMWEYGVHKLRDLGFRSVFTGWSLSLVKDSLGFGAFFATFEYVKAQSFYAFVTRYYGGLDVLPNDDLYTRGPDGNRGVTTIRPHYALEPSFLMLAGISASLAQQTIQYPLAMIQDVHYTRFDSLDTMLKNSRVRLKLLENYGNAYRNTLRECSSSATQVGGWRKWLYKGFWTNTVRQLPSISAGLVIFELVRRRYATEAEAVRIEKDGYDILLS